MKNNNEARVQARDGVGASDAPRRRAFLTGTDTSNPHI
jgi:hypothetical protein